MMFAFLQMVWEQGSVVIVMLTKLTENGEAMCHRYWPEEGSDLYHIYEVRFLNYHIGAQLDGSVEYANCISAEL